eukprot:TRINITY_DN4104_c0_g1_i1.p1 TRINITY_DN4104_c0_g1~~TRINITY_DN4104_c0_g1_i1.p1  ORF type:complete len:442 (+),score=114.88 TRINITY_DN4104_c0_g1_i1:105-1430(+)
MSLYARQLLFCARLWTQAAIGHIWCTRLRPLLLGSSSPPGPGDAVVSVVWMASALRQAGVLGPNDKVVSVVIEDLSGNRGLASALCRLRITYGAETTGAPGTLILKMYKVGNIASRKTAIATGAFREGLFYASSYAKAATGVVAPRAYFAQGSAWSGELILLLEDITEQNGDNAVPVNFILGNQVWGVPRPVPAEAPAKAEVLRAAFLAAADMQAMHWNDRSLIDSPRNWWMKAPAWYRGEGRTLWSLGIDFAHQRWKHGMALAAAGKDGVEWSPVLIKIINRAFESTSWDELQRHLHDPAVPFTLTHGDFHASNMFWVMQTGLRAFDWAEVGPWEPTADLGQMMISDVRPDVRRACEREVVKAYADRLAEKGVNYSFERAWADYCRTGAERWIMGFAVLVGFGLPAVAVQYFHDQLLAFIVDHGGNEDSVFKLKTVWTLV